MTLTKLIHKKLYLGDSDFRCCILKYDGKDSNFKFHYDTEPYNCYRCIYLFDAAGNISPFSYYDENGNMITDLSIKSKSFCSEFRGITRTNAVLLISYFLILSFISITTLPNKLPPFKLVLFFYFV